VSKTPFTDFLNKTKHKEFSERLYREVLELFEGHGLSELQIRAFLWGTLKDIEEEVKKENQESKTPQQVPFTYGPPRPWPPHTGGGSS
jgi:hypothetical protein